MNQGQPDHDAKVRHLYLHIPFCHRICPYCSFYKHTPGATDRRRFVEALAEEARRAAGSLPLDLETIYFGGGTPTLLSHTHLEELLDALAGALDFRGVREWTVEANPRTFDADKLAIMRAAGVTRISLGVQSWQPRFLDLLGRDHQPGEAREAFGLIRAAGFPTASIDLMFALPGQSLADWESDLAITRSLDPDHISTYNLTYEEDTEFMRRFERGEFHQDADADAPFFLFAHDCLETAGFHHYEVSNYARPGHESRHNQAYWDGADYLGLGPSAVSTIHGSRWTNLADTARYIECIERFGHARRDEEILTRDAWRTERLALALRTTRGLDRAVLGPGFGEILRKLEDDGLALPDGDRLRLTPRGRLLVDGVAAELMGA